MLRGVGGKSCQFGALVTLAARRGTGSVSVTVPRGARAALPLLARAIRQLCAAGRATRDAAQRAHRHKMAKRAAADDAMAQSRRGGSWGLADAEYEFRKAYGARKHAKHGKPLASKPRTACQARHAGHAKHGMPGTARQRVARP